MLLFASLLVLLLVPDMQARPQDCEIFGCEEPAVPSSDECDPIFGDCEEEEEIEVDTRSECFDSINEIDSLDNDGR